MNERMGRLLDVFRAAEADVDASKKRLREVSAARLAGLLELPPARRFQALDDPALTAFDRVTLERSVEDALPRVVVRVPRRWALSARSVRRFAWHHRRGLLRVVLAAGPVTLFGLSAWLHTPPQDALPVVFAVPLDVRWTMPDGSVTPDFERAPVGTEAVWYRTGFRADLRRWFPGQGYGTVEDVPGKFFLQHEIVLRQVLAAVPPRS